MPATCILVMLATLAPVAAVGAAEPVDAEAEALFVRRIAPLLQAKCIACHGGDPAKLEGGLDLRSRAAALGGGDSGEPALRPGRPDESPLYRAAGRDDDVWSAMPPKEAERLTAEQLADLGRWLKAGAPWPDEARAREIARANADRWSAEDGVVVRTSGGLSPDWTDRKYKPEGLWAYLPVRKPQTKGTGSAAIDELLARRLPEGLQLAPPADARTFLRRATFDLLGLPPTPEEVAAFEAAYVRDADTAVAALVDRLLQSPHYGEQMARHWLDVVRYADSSGFANDFERGNAWRYRDYVVRAFNDDKPYDRFIREQIAGDEIDPNDPEMLVAVGFLRMGPWELTGMEVARVARQRWLDDVTNAVGETFLAHSLQCARCHDHKFDPIPTRDYYALQAVFATTQLAERPAPFLPGENTAGFGERKYFERSVAEHEATLRTLDDKLLANAERWYAERKLDPTTWHEAVAAARSGAGRKGTVPRRGGSVFDAARARLQQQGVAEDRYPPKLVGFTASEFGAERVARKGLERLRWELERYEPFALSVYDGRTPDVKAVLSPVRVPANRLTAGELEETCILAGGDPFSPAAKVGPGVLSAVAGVPQPTMPDVIEGRRRALAEWIAHRDNPLTTRTIVNRVWLWHFNEPLAGNPNNFGSTGKRPTHPELLDRLAATFVEGGWSFKTLHRAIMNSAAYRRGTEPPDRAALAKLDPAGTSYAVFKPRRLAAEELRDAALAATGELNPTLGGIPNRPEINLEAALQPRQVMGTFAAAWTPNPLPRERHRRSLYALRLRGLADPALETFNAPGPDFSCERREASIVTPQVFALFNSRAGQARALALAARALRESADDAGAVDRCFRLVYGRPATDDERASCLAHLQAMEPIEARAKYEAAPRPTVVRREAVEENTGEKFTFDERLHAYAEFVPDLEPAGCDVRTRALAHVCLVLLNSNEFVYVY